MEFTDQKIQALKLTGNQATYKDSESPLYIRVGGKTKAWFIRYQLNGKRHMINLGQYPDMSLKDARLMAEKRLFEVKESAEMTQVKRDDKESATMTDLWVEYLETRSRRQKKADSTLDEEYREWEEWIEPALGNMKVTDVGQPVVVAFLNSIADDAPIMANRTHSLLNIMFDVAIDLGWLDQHPMYSLKEAGGLEDSRSRVLSDDEIRALWSAFDELGANSRDILRLVLLTAQRPDEVMAMRWEDLDLDECLWTQQANKARTTNLVPLSRQAMDILSRRPNNSEWVFPDRRYKGRKSSYTQHTKQARQKATKLSGVTNWRSHDFRRTAQTIMSRLGVTSHIVECCLNHAIDKGTETDDRYSYLDEKRSALDKLGREVDRIISGL